MAELPKSQVKSNENTYTDVEPSMQFSKTGRDRSSVPKHFCRCEPSIKDPVG